MFKKITFALLVLTAIVTAAEINVTIETDKPNYRIGQTVNWTIKAWASAGDNRGVNTVSVKLTEDSGEALQLPLMDGVDFLGTDYSQADGFTTAPVYVSPSNALTSMVVYQIQIVPDIGNDGSEKVLSQGNYLVGNLGTHTLDIELEGAFYWPTSTSLIAVPFETDNVSDIVFGVYHRADINYDGNVDSDDLAILSGQWLATGAGLQADIEPADGDGIVDMNDFALLAEEWLITGP